MTALLQKGGPRAAPAGRGPGIRYRYETFGGIIALDNPPALAFVDKDFLVNIGKGPSPLWDNKDAGLLSGPVEAHAALTRYCGGRCPGCYMASVDEPSLLGEDGLEKAQRIADTLAGMGVFHAALGGGESMALPWLFDMARYYRGKGMVPNLTTSGLGMDREKAEKCRVFGQVNVSLDTPGPDISSSRPDALSEKAIKALSLLKKAKVRAGINCVVSRHNFEHLDTIIRFAKKMGARDIELLRFKPAGRGKDIYQDMALLPDQAKNLFPVLKKIARKRRFAIKLDCSFTPFVCFHNPVQKVLEFFCILGCDAGNWLIGVDPEAKASPCSFLDDGLLDLGGLKRAWDNPRTFSTCRDWENQAGTPCSDCPYLSLCKGGCHAVAGFLKGSQNAPDPECPRVRGMAGS